MANPLATRRGRYTVFFLLYLSEGLPLGLNLFALSAFLRAQGVSMADVGAFGAAVMAPWGLKFLWSPFIDLIRIRRFGPSRFWIVLTQTMMAVTLAFLFWLDPVEDFALLVTLMTIHNVFASAQDVAIDGLAVRVAMPAPDVDQISRRPGSGEGQSSPSEGDGVESQPDQEGVHKSFFLF